MVSSGDWEKAVTYEPTMKTMEPALQSLTLPEMSVSLPITAGFACPTVGCLTIFASVSVRQAAVPLL